MNLSFEDKKDMSCNLSKSLIEPFKRFNYFCLFYGKIETKKGLKKKNTKLLWNSLLYVRFFLYDVKIFSKNIQATSNLTGNVFQNDKKACYEYSLSTLSVLFPLSLLLSPPLLFSLLFMCACCSSPSFFLMI